MHKVAVWCATLFFIISALLFDSLLLRGMAGGLYPAFHLFLWVIGSFILLAAFRSTIVGNGVVQLIVVFFFILTLSGVVSSFLAGYGTLLALSSKLLTIAINAVMVILGYNIGKSSAIKESMGFATLYLAIAGVLVALFLERGQFNQNWLALTLMFGVVFFSTKTNPSHLVSIILFSIVSAVSLLYFESRGVFIACGLAALIIIIQRLFAKNILPHFFYGAVGYGVPAISLCTVIVGTLLFESPLYEELNTASRELTGKAINPSRLNRWVAAIDAFRERPVIGWGLDSNLIRIAEGDVLSIDGIQKLGEAHNIWAAAAYKTGIVGVACLFFSFMIIGRQFERRIISISIVGGWVACLVGASVYGLGGFTHWPGTFWFWLFMGLILSAPSVGSQIPEKGLNNSSAAVPRAGGS